MQHNILHQNNTKKRRENGDCTLSANFKSTCVSWNKKYSLTVWDIHGSHTLHQQTSKSKLDTSTDAYETLLRKNEMKI